MMKAIAIFIFTIFYGGFAVAESLCDSPLAYQVGTDEECIKQCPNRETNDSGSGTGMNYTINCALKKCPMDKPLRIDDGSCFSCYESKLPVSSVVKNCLVCPNRVEVHLQNPLTTVCSLKECPHDAPLRAWLQGCYACSDTDYYAQFETKNCDVCPNRIKVKNKMGEARCEIQIDQSDSNVVVAKDDKCPTNIPLKRWDGCCFSCDTNDTIALDSKCNDKWGTCEYVCPNREIVYQVGGNPSSFLKCPDATPLRDSNGKCQACDAGWDINMKFQDTTKCESICPNRIQPKDSVLCALKNSIR